MESNTTTTCEFCDFDNNKETMIATGRGVQVYMFKDENGDCRIYGQADDDTDAEKINFCPFCGRDLR